MVSNLARLRWSDDWRWADTEVRHRTRARLDQFQVSMAQNSTNMTAVEATFGAVESLLEKG